MHHALRGILTSLIKIKWLIYFFYGTSQNLTNPSSFPLISNHCSISIGKNQLIPHVISNNHKNARTEASMAVLSGVSLCKGTHAIFF